MSDIINLTLSALIDKIKKKELSSQEITSAYIARAEKSKDLNTYITTDFENAIEKAPNCFIKWRLLTMFFNYVVACPFLT